MATTQITISSNKSASPLALWHLLSLDAPTVAVVWTWFVARANGIRLPLTSTAAMGLAVWMLYAADRLLDARGSAAQNLEARHLFHRRHRAAFLGGSALAAITLAALLPSLGAAALHLYLAESALLFAWFVVLHATRSAHRLPKEIAVGFFFAAAIYIPTVAREPALRLALLPSAALFAALCSLNCLYIYAWEHESADSDSDATPPPHRTTRMALRHIAGLALGIAAAGIALLLYGGRAWPIVAACSLSSVALGWLHLNRHRMARTTLRAAADLALLTPVAVAPFLR